MPKFSRLRKKTRSMRVRISIEVFAILSVVFLSVWIVIAERAFHGVYGPMDKYLESLVEVIAEDYFLRNTPETKSEKRRNPTGSSADFLFEIRTLPEGSLLDRSERLGSGSNLIAMDNIQEIVKQAGDEGWNHTLEGEPHRYYGEVVSIPGPC